MKRKIVLMAVLAFMFTAICTTQTVPSVHAETNTTSTSEPLLLLEEPSFPKWFVDAKGTVFHITNSSYLNVTLTSSENVHVLLESVPRVVSYHIKSLSSAISTELTLSGLIASTTYYRYQDGNLTESFITDSTGNYTYVLDISSPHHIFIVENITTIYIRSDGSIEPETAPIQRVGDIYTFTANIYETIIVQKSNIVIDGNGYTLKGRGAGSYPYVYGFYIHGAGSVVVRSTRVEALTWGIYLSSSSNDMILNNNITDNNEGLSLVYSFNATLRNNHMSGGAPFVVKGNVLSDFIHDIDSSNTVNGKPMYYWVNQQDRIVPVDAGYVALVNSTNIKAQNLNLEPAHWEGLLLAYTNNSLISDNNIRHGGFGIYSFVSSNNTISDNNIELWGMNGIYFLDSSDNMISGNNIAYTSSGILLKSSSNNTISGNNIALKNDLGILLGSSNNNTISDNNIMNCFLYGIAISESFLNIISSNNITNNRYGIGLGGSSNNSISGNNITANNVYGIGLGGSSNYNIIYHNNLIDNGVQASDMNPANNNWHHPDLLEGNYWSDYPGVDDGSGTGKHAIAGDGIGDTNIPWPATDYDYYPFVSKSGWEKIQFQITVGHSGVGSDFTGTVVIIDGIDYGVGGLPVNFWWDEGSGHTFAFQSPLVATPNATQHLWNSTTGLSTLQNETITVSASGSIIGNYKTQYYLTVTSLFDMPGGEGWYDEGETAHAILAIGLEYIDSLAYGFVGWSGDATGWDLISDPIIMDAPKTVVANWESSEVYGDVRTVGFWKHQVNVWYFTELKNNGMRIRGIGTAQVSQDEMMVLLKFISDNSDYTRFQGIWVEGNKLATLENAYDILKNPRGPDSMKMRAEQQLLALWLNLAYKAFFWNTELSQDTIYVYYQYTFDEFDGLVTIGEAIKFCEAELLNNGNFEAVKDICDSINNNLGIIWGT